MKLIAVIYKQEQLFPNVPYINNITYWVKCNRMILAETRVTSNLLQKTHEQLIKATQKQGSQITGWWVGSKKGVYYYTHLGNNFKKVIKIVKY